MKARPELSSDAERPVHGAARETKLKQSIRYPDFGFEWHHFLRRPWKARWWLRPLSRYYGAQFRHYHALLTESLGWSAERLHEHQWRLLKQLIDHAYRTTPFYRRYFAENKITPDDIRTPADFRQLPLVDRNVLRERLAEFRSTEFERYGGFASRTSGTTARLLTFYRTPQVEAVRRAAQWRHFHHMGYDYRQPRVSLNVPFVGEEADLLYIYDPIENVVMFNGRFLDVETVDAIAEVCARFEPRMFYGHPSAMITLAKQLEKRKLPPLRVPMVYTYSEVITDAMRAAIREYIGQETFDYYGNRENSISAAQYRCGNYHINAEFVYLELEKSTEQFEGQTLSHVVGTNLHNYAMPLLRYDCSDLAIDLKPCDRCRLPQPVIRFVGGREKNFLVSRRGLIHCQFDDILWKQSVNMPDDLQVEQIDLENVILRIVPSQNYDRNRDEQPLIDYLKDSTKNLFQVKVEYVDDIPPTAGFKRPKVLSRLGQNIIDA